jgi:hypothetical protein
VAGEIAEIGKRGMRAVQHAQLGMFERRDVADELCAGDFPRRTRAVYEPVLQHPLAERLVHDRRRVMKPDRLVDRVDVAGGFGGHDAIDHAGRERNVCLDPGGKPVVAKRREVSDQTGK